MGRKRKRVIFEGGQIAGQVKDAPEILLRRMKVIISERFVDFLYDITSGKQGLQFPGNTGIGVVDKRADDVTGRWFIHFAQREESEETASP